MNIIQLLSSYSSSSSSSLSFFFSSSCLLFFFFFFSSSSLLLLLLLLLLARLCYALCLSLSLSLSLAHSLLVSFLCFLDGICALVLILCLLSPVVLPLLFLSEKTIKSSLQHDVTTIMLVRSKLNNINLASWRNQNETNIKTDKAQGREGWGELRRKEMKRREKRRMMLLPGWPAMQLLRTPNRKQPQGSPPPRPPCGAGERNGKGTVESKTPRTNTERTVRALGKFSISRMDKMSSDKLCKSFVHQHNKHMMLFIYQSDRHQYQRESASAKKEASQL